MKTLSFSIHISNNNKAKQSNVKKLTSDELNKTIEYVYYYKSASTKLLEVCVCVCARVDIEIIVCLTYAVKWTFLLVAIFPLYPHIYTYVHTHTNKHWLYFIMNRRLNRFFLLFSFVQYIYTPSVCSTQKLKFGNEFVNILKASEKETVHIIIYPCHWRCASSFFLLLILFVFGVIFSVYFMPSHLWINTWSKEARTNKDRNTIATHEWFKWKACVYDYENV